MNGFYWTCPNCNTPTFITPENCQRDERDLLINNKDGLKRLITMFIICPAPKCKKLSIRASLYDIINYSSSVSHGPTIDLGPFPIKSWQLIPPSKAKPFPDYIPEQIRDDYKEAYLICDLSPKASAALSRRCLQGMIRDFWDVKGKNLKDEIEKIKDKVDSDTWGAIDAVRSVGNIGAHMEKDVNLIIDIEPKEANLLIGLIETLLKDWYVARENRKKNLEEIKEMAKKKEEAKKTKKKENSGE